MLSKLHLLPHDDRFFDLFNQAANNILEAARLLEQLIEDPSDVERKARHLTDIEHHGDEITHAIFDALNRTFVTPLDREDISALAAALDDVVDLIEDVSRRMRLYRKTEATPLARRLVRISREQAEQIAAVIPCLERWQEVETVRRATREIHRLENEADDVLAEALGTLYDGVTDVPQMISAHHWGEIYELLEDATDRAEHVAVAVQNIDVKRHA